MLFVDTFTRYFDPSVAGAAREVLLRFGYEPTVPATIRKRGRPLCCGRTWISAGFLDRARAEVRRTLAALAPLARQGLPIVGLEPSCLLTLRDEALYLCPGDDARLVAGHAFLADEFLAGGQGADPATAAPPATAAVHRTTPPDHADPGEPRSPAAVRGPATHIHGHCHQKAAGTATATADALATLAGVTATLIESSCCGMAGGFGYTAKHLRTSRAMGELGLFPALRAAAPEDTVIANGFSCRAQIRAGTGRRARHFVEVLAERLRG